MRTRSEYLSGEYNEELRALVAEARGYSKCENDPDHPEDIEGWTGYKDGVLVLAPPFSTSLDACRELLMDLTEEKRRKFVQVLYQLIQPDHVVRGWWKANVNEIWLLFNATARQICVAYLIVKGILK